MKTTVHTINDTTVRVAVTLDADELAAAKQIALHKLSKTVKVAGFRKGKVPASVAAKHVSPAALDEQTLEDALSKAVADAFTSEKLQALDRPAVEITKYVPDQELEFTAETEVIPKIKIGNYKKLKLAKEAAKVTAVDINDMIERLRANMATSAAVTRAAKNGDETVIDFVGKRDDVAFDGGTGSDYPLELGSNSFIPGFEEAVVGHKTGDEFDVPLTFPEDYHAKDLAGAKVVFTVTIKEVKEKTLPELNDEFAAKVGPFTSVDDLKADIKRELGDQQERESAEKLKDEAVKQLVAASNVPTPEILVTDQTNSIEQDFMQNLSYRGMALEQYLSSSNFADRDEWIAKEVRPAAVERVKAGLLLAELSKVEDIKATSEELAEMINSYKSRYANNPDMAKRFDDPMVQRDLANRLLTEKTVERLVELNTKK